MQEQIQLGNMQDQKSIGSGKKERTVNNPHDKGYKRIFMVKKNFLDFIQKYVAMDWMQELTVDDIELVNKEFITDQFDTYESDLVYKIHVKDNEIYMFFLQELQSKNDFTMPFRLLVYMTAIWMDYFKNTKKKERTRKEFRLPPIFPLVLYNGTEKWTAKRQLREMVNGADFLKDYIINFRYALVSVTELERDFITSSNTLIDNIIYADSFTEDKDWVENIERLGNRLTHLPKEDVNAWITWFQKALQGLDKESKQEIVERIRNGDVNNMCNSFERILNTKIEEGLAKGMKEGIRKGMEEGMKEGMKEGIKEGREKEREQLVMSSFRKGKTPEEIADFLDLALEQVQQIVTRCSQE